MAQTLLPRWAFHVTIILIVLSLLSFLVSSIVISAQVMDFTLLAIFTKAFALEFYPHFGFTSVSSAGNSISPFGNAWVLSLGYIVVFFITIPFGLLKLHNNIFIQKLGWIVMMVIVLEFVIGFFIVGLDSKRLPVIGSNQAQVLGTIIFNYSFIITVPSWINEKKPEVNITKSVWITTTAATSLYIILGVLGSLAFNFSSASDILSAFVENTSGPLKVISQICVYLFPAAALLSTIPIFSIVIRYNLIQSGLIKSKGLNNFAAVFFPWIISIVFYAGAGLLQIIK